MSDKTEAIYLYPGPDGWNLGTVDVRAGEIRSEPVDLPLGGGQRDGVVVCLPATVFSSLPVRVDAGVDADSRVGLVRLQMEKEGICAEDTPDRAVRVTEVRERDDGLVFQGVVLDDALPDELCIEEAARFDCAVRQREFPDNQLSIHNELGTPVATLTLDGRLIHFQPLGCGADSMEFASEVALLVSSLEETVDLGGLTGVTICFPVGEDVMQALSDAVGVPVSTAPEPPFHVAADPWSFEPAPVRTMRERTRRGRRIRGLATAAVAVLLLVLAGLGARLILLHREASGLRADIARHADEVAGARETAALWQRMELALRPDLFPIERLYQATRLLPDQGVRLVVFEQRGADIVIAGEASSTPAAIKYSNDLRRSPEWSGFEWEIPQPKILPNNSAQFRITARRIGGDPLVEATP